MKKYFAWTKNITKKMVLIWAISFVGVLTIVFGSVALGLGLNRVNYGSEINYDNVFGIRYMNENQNKFIHKNSADSDLHENTMREILNLLAAGGRTNKLANLFRSTSDDTVSVNTSDWVWSGAFENAFPTNAMVIEFATPQYRITSNTERTQFALENAIAGSNVNNVHAIYIPLDRTQNKFQEQVWYFQLTPTTGNSVELSRKLTTMGNYHKLGNYVGERFIVSP